MHPLYVVRNGLRGRGLRASLDAESLFAWRGFAIFFVVGAALQKYSSIAGLMSSISKNRGLEAYKVVARRIAPALRRKSTAKGIVVYCAKN